MNINCILIYNTNYILPKNFLTAGDQEYFQDLCGVEIKYVR